MHEGPGMMHKICCFANVRWTIFATTIVSAVGGCASTGRHSEPSPADAAATNTPKTLFGALSGTPTAPANHSDPRVTAVQAENFGQASPSHSATSQITPASYASPQGVPNPTRWTSLEDSQPMVRRTPPLDAMQANQIAHYQTTRPDGSPDPHVEMVGHHGHGCRGQCPHGACPHCDHHRQHCMILGHRHPGVPRELQKVSLPDYVVEPPDILLIDVIKAVPKAPYRFAIFDTVRINMIKAVPSGPHRLEALDVIYLRVAGLPERFPIEGNYSINPGGMLDLGDPYGSINVKGMTLDQAREAVKGRLVDFKDPQVELLLVQGALPQTLTGEYVISPSGTITLGTYGEVYLAGRTRLDAENVVRHHLEKNGLEEVKLSLDLGTFAAIQQVVGEHMVGPDGTVMLGGYGQVYVTGMTRSQARAAVEAHLSLFLEDPRVSLDVFAFNSKVYYVIVQGTGMGDGVFRLPVTGNETVLDAIAQIQGLQPQSSKRIWVARPKPPGEEGACDQLLEVNWRAIVKGGSTETNYQLFPGDRLYIAEDNWWTVDTFIAKVTSPFERLFGFNLLGSSVVSNYRFFKQQGSRGNGGF